MIVRATAILLAVLVSASLTAQSPNDDCSGAIPLISGVEEGFDTTLDTASGLDPGCGGAAAPIDVWYSYTSDFDGTLSVQTCGSSLDTRLAMWEGTCGSLSLTSCVDDSCGLSSELYAFVTTGNTYYIQLGGFSQQVGTGSITLTPFVDHAIEAVVFRVGESPGTYDIAPRYSLGIGGAVTGEPYLADIETQVNAASFGAVTIGAQTNAIMGPQCYTLPIGMNCGGGFCSDWNANPFNLVTCQAQSTVNYSFCVCLGLWWCLPWLNDVALDPNDTVNQDLAVSAGPVDSRMSNNDVSAMLTEPVQNLSGVMAPGGGVELTWDNAQVYLEIEIWRDGEPIGFESGSATGFTDPTGGSLYQVYAHGSATSIGFAEVSLGATFRRGDPNGDGLIDIGDPIFHLAALFSGGPNSPCADSADANDDGGLNIADGIYMLGFLFSSAPPPGAPYPNCGSDPTDDTLDCQSYQSCL